ncbi:MAG: diguanylate cyclase AdrA [Pseudomonas sp.]|nr:diguanylate cyclase AdrA [Pseudomonas sp.]
MQEFGGKGPSLSRRLLKSRSLGTALGFLCIAAASYPLHKPDWFWALMIFNAFAWPLIAYKWSSRSSMQYRAEQRNLLIDSFMGGFWVGSIQFNMLPSIITISMMSMNNMAIAGPRFLFKGLLAQAAGLACSLLIFSFAFSPQTSLVQIYACVPLLAIYPAVIGWITYQQTHLLRNNRRELRALSQTDSLSGLLNHGAWKDCLNTEFRRCKQSHQAGTIALIDIDHFKTINDTYGHVVGDNVLRELSRVLTQNLRAADLAGRYGGDEFCVILPHTPLATAAEIMDRLRDTFSSTQYELEPLMKVSLSIGLAAYSPQHPDATSWLNEADKALYGAKTTGRNRVSCMVDGAFHQVVRDLA